MIHGLVRLGAKLWPSWFIVLAWLSFAREADAHRTTTAEVRVYETAPGQYLVDVRSPYGGVRLEVPSGCTEAPASRETAPFDQARRELRCDDGGARHWHVLGLGDRVDAAWLEVQSADGRRDAAMLTAASPSLTTRASSAGVSIASYAEIGAHHLIGGLDHVLFLLGLAWLARSFRDVAAASLAFTVAHSLTLALATLELFAIPTAIAELLIAVSLVLLALDIGCDRPPARSLVASAFGFGLVHGLGFADALASFRVDPSDLPMALLGFNLGIEAAQLACLAAIAVTARLIARHAVATPARVAASGRVLAYTIGAIGVHLALSRLDVLIEGV